MKFKISINFNYLNSSGFAPSHLRNIQQNPQLYLVEDLYLFLYSYSKMSKLKTLKDTFPTVKLNMRTGVMH